MMGRLDLVVVLGDGKGGEGRGGSGTVVKGVYAYVT
jgi:hypothetical protein